MSTQPHRFWFQKLLGLKHHHDRQQPKLSLACCASTRSIKERFFSESPSHVCSAATWQIRRHHESERFLRCNSACVASALQCPHRLTHTTASSANTPPSQTNDASGDSSGARSPEYVRTLDLFAKSRILNYLQRVKVVEPDSDEARDGCGSIGSSGSTGSKNPFRVTRVSSLGNDDDDGDRSLISIVGGDSGGSEAFRAEMCIPVELPVAHATDVPNSSFQNYERVILSAIGYAANEKDAMLAAAMHAELCLDVHGVPIFTSMSMQKKRADSAAKSGRYAPMPGDALKPIGSVPLKSCVIHQPIVPDDIRSSTDRKNLTSEARTKGSKRIQNGNPASTNSSSSRMSANSAKNERFSAENKYGFVPFHPNYSSRTHKKKPKRVIRFGADPFLRGVQGELAYLQASIFSYCAATEEDDGDFGSGSGEENRSSVGAAAPQGKATQHNESGNEISLGDIEIIDDVGRSSRLYPRAHAPNSSSPVGVYIPALSVEACTPLKDARQLGFLDESEGGKFNLVECEDVWLSMKDVPSMPCLYDRQAVHRLKPFYSRVCGGDTTFESTVATAVSEEETQVDSPHRPSHGRKMVTWFTSTARIPGFPSLTAVGKATNVGISVHLCAAHMELLLNCLGVPLADDPILQTKQMDACLCYGRIFSPEERTAEEAAAVLPKPLKQWAKIGKQRKRGSQMSLDEKVMLLNRRLVGTIRQHLVEIKVPLEMRHTLLTQSVAAVRQFMIDQQHPYESAYITYLVSEGAQCRTSIYLPLEAKYGVRGGCAIAGTSETAKGLAALHAVDTLCALGIPVFKDEKKQQALIEQRRELGLILPRPGVNANIRSPPGYREVKDRGVAAIPSHLDVWNVMMMDAKDFDAVEMPAEALAREAHLPSVTEVLRILFMTFLQVALSIQSSDDCPRPNHYQGTQHVGGLTRIHANNYWMTLPLDEAKYGRRVALGRCVQRRSAERCFHVHVLRILKELDALPWTTTTLGHLQPYKGTIRSEMKLQQMWSFVDKHIISNSTTDETAEENSVSIDTLTSLDQFRYSTTTTVRDAEINAVDKRMVPSPNPVMSMECANATIR